VVLLGTSATKLSPELAAARSIAASGSPRPTGRRVERIQVERAAGDHAPHRELRTTASFEAAQGLRDGSLDVALVRDFPPQDGLVVETIATEAVLAALPERHRLAAGLGVALEPATYALLRR
jgi:DNA-binding transcriptional LysR family regulator